jgi:hypothetical protein
MPGGCLRLSSATAEGVKKAVDSFEMVHTKDKSAELDELINEPEEYVKGMREDQPLSVDMCEQVYI